MISSYAFNQECPGIRLGVVANTWSELKTTHSKLRKATNNYSMWHGVMYRKTTTKITSCDIVTRSKKTGKEQKLLHASRNNAKEIDSAILPCFGGAAAPAPGPAITPPRPAVTPSQARRRDRDWHCDRHGHRHCDGGGPGSNRPLTVMVRIRNVSEFVDTRPEVLATLERVSESAVMAR
jgi:hypothetical protein